MNTYGTVPLIPPLPRAGVPSCTTVPWYHGTVGTYGTVGKAWDEVNDLERLMR